MSIILSLHPGDRSEPNPSPRDNEANLKLVFPRNIEPARAISIALTICGFPVGERSGIVRLILLALEKTGSEIVSSEELKRLREGSRGT